MSFIRDALMGNEVSVEFNESTEYTAVQAVYDDLASLESIQASVEELLGVVGEMPSLESAGDVGLVKYNLRLILEPHNVSVEDIFGEEVSVEGLKDGLKALWDAIVRASRKLLEVVEGFMLKLFSSTNGLTKRLEKCEEFLKSMDESLVPKEPKLKVSGSFINCLGEEAEVVMSGPIGNFLDTLVQFGDNNLEVGKSAIWINNDLVGGKGIDDEALATLFADTMNTFYTEGDGTVFKDTKVVKPIDGVEYKSAISTVGGPWMVVAPIPSAKFRPSTTNISTSNSLLGELTGLSKMMLVKRRDYKAPEEVTILDRSDMLTSVEDCSTLLGTLDNGADGFKKLLKEQREDLSSVSINSSGTDGDRSTAYGVCAKSYRITTVNATKGIVNAYRGVHRYLNARINLLEAMIATYK